MYIALQERSSCVQEGKVEQKLNQIALWSAELAKPLFLTDFSFNLPSPLEPRLQTCLTLSGYPMTHCPCKRQQCSGQPEVVQGETSSVRHLFSSGNNNSHAPILLLHSLGGPGSAGFPYPVRHELESHLTHEASLSTTTKLWSFFNAFRFIENGQKVETWLKTWLIRQLVEEHGLKKKNMPSLSKNERNTSNSQSCNSVFKSQSRLINWQIHNVSV